MGGEGIFNSSNHRDRDYSHHIPQCRQSCMEDYLNPVSKYILYLTLLIRHWKHVEETQFFHDGMNKLEGEN